MERVVSGIRPTGKLHLGNYFGAVVNFLKMQENHDCFFFVADYHALTTHPEPQDMHNSVKQVLAEYIACGLDPYKCTLYVQSDLPETAELYLLLGMLAYKGELERATTYKEKVASQPKNINAGLLSYPVLMAADILIHQANKVPVGEDQRQHLEMTRVYARRFNHIYKTDLFPEPVAYNFGEKLVKIPGLDGMGKMGKSEGNAVYLFDEPEVIQKKVMRAVTDSGPTKKNQEKPEAIQNIFTLLKVVSTPKVIEQYDAAYKDCTIRYGDLKKQLADDIITFSTPIRERIKEILSDAGFIKKTVKLGAEKARESAKETIKQAREAIGIKKFY